MKPQQCHLKTSIHGLQKTYLTRVPWVYLYPALSLCQLRAMIQTISPPNPKLRPRQAKRSSTIFQLSSLALVDMDTEAMPSWKPQHHEGLKAVAGHARQESSPRPLSNAPSRPLAFLRQTQAFAGPDCSPSRPQSARGPPSSSVHASRDEGRKAVVYRRMHTSVTCCTKRSSLSWAASCSSSALAPPRPQISSSRTLHLGQVSHPASGVVYEELTACCKSTNRKALRSDAIVDQQSRQQLETKATKRFESNKPVWMASD